MKSPIFTTQVASSVPFDTANNDFIGTNTQEAIEESYNGFSIKRIRSNKSVVIKTDRELSLLQSLTLDLNSSLTIQLDGGLVIYGA